MTSTVTDMRSQIDALGSKLKDVSTEAAAATAALQEQQNAAAKKRRERHFRQAEGGEFPPVETVAGHADRSAETIEGHAGSGREEPHGSGRRVELDQRRTERLDRHNS